MKLFLTDLRSALSFITVLPVGNAYSPTGMIRCFPLAGMIVGTGLLIFDLVISFFWNTPTVAILDTIFLVAITGAFHLDGLGDTADGLFSHRSKTRVLEIMKDSRTGMMGLIAVFCILAVKAAGIYSAKIHHSTVDMGIMFLIIPAYARGAMIFGMKFLNYGRSSEGTGFELFQGKIKLNEFAFFLIPVVVSLALGGYCLILNLFFLTTLTLVLWFYKKMLNCITGDMLGALNEIMEAVLFLAMGIQLCIT